MTSFGHAAVNGPPWPFVFVISAVTQSDSPGEVLQKTRLSLAGGQLGDLAGDD